MGAFPTYTGVVITNGPKPLQRRFRGIMKAELQVLPRLWHKAFLPRHFRSGAERQYGYKQRSWKYLARKKRIKGHQKPLTYTGQTKRVMSLAPLTTGTALAAKGRMNVPFYVRLIPKNPNRPSMGKELLATTNREAIVLGKKLDVNVKRAMDRIRTRERRRI